jgi:hypothetical protein
MGERMNKFIQRVLFSKYSIILIIAAICLNVWLTRQREVDYKYNGIKFQIGSRQSAEPMSIELKGKYKKVWYRKEQIFKGQIIVDGERFYGGTGDEELMNTFVFKRWNFGFIDSGSTASMLFIDEMLREITIGIFEPKSADGHGVLSYKNGWLIAAPCNAREEAVVIANRLIQKHHKDVIIK